MTTSNGFQQQLPQDVIRRAQQGDMMASENIYTTYCSACHNLAYRICNNQMMAQDIVQEVFIKVLRQISSYRNEGSFAGWLRRIVANETVNRIRAEYRLRLVDERDIFDLTTNDLFNQDWLSACRDLDGLLKQLSTTSRAVLLLHEVEGYNHQEIADFFGKSESFSKVTLNRAFSSLKKIVLSQEKKDAFN